MKTIKILGIDLAKNIFQLHGRDELEREILDKRLSRAKFVEFIQNLPPCIIGMEACSGSQHWARLFQKMGHEVRLVSPQFVKPYVRGDKTDRNDARAIAECVTRPGMRFVAVKTVLQQEAQMQHRIRQRLVRNRTALSNELRGLFSEFGYAIPTGYKALKDAILRIVGEESCPLSEQMRMFILELRSELLELDEKISRYDQLFEQRCREVDVCKRLLDIPGVGPITATALWAHIADAFLFKNGRQFAAYLGLTPRQHSSGGKKRLLGISKRGDKYIRKLLVHGARSVIRFSETKTDIRSLWVKRIDEERGRNKACVALANKNARVIWALMKSGDRYRKAESL